MLPFGWEGVVQLQFKYNFVSIVWFCNTKKFLSSETSLHFEMCVETPHDVIAALKDQQCLYILLL